MSLVLQDGEAARALRYCARTITTRVRELQRVSRGAASETVTQQHKEKEGDLEEEEEPAATSAGGVVDDYIDNDTSPDEWLEKLADARRKWMVTLHRYGSNVRDGSEWRDGGGGCRGRNLDGAPNHGEGRHTAVASGLLEVTNDDRNHQHHHHHHQTMIVPAADFCPRCSSVVQVAFEYTAQGKLLAEHRGGCAPCDKSTLYGQARHTSKGLDMRSLPRSGHQASGVL